ncbi:MAG: MFS transporter [Bacteroidetes bacterium CG2_30_33_31]|nr:MAG: MFS transporter [Bacteroidetes bacterium CG2_30_33_31]
MIKKNIFKAYPRTFWIANTIELVERWAWYGFFMLFANYLTSSSDMGGLELTQSQKGWIMGIGTGILYFLPVITGSIADKYGYKKVLFIAFSVYTSAFFIFPYFDSFTGVFAVYLYLALGAALFKPIISATISKTTDESNSSVGFGIFYMMVNIGAFFGPMITLFFKSSSYSVVFQLSAVIIALNFILLLFYKEPGRVKSKSSFKEIISVAFTNIGKVLKDFKFIMFLLIVAGFWTMFNQLFFTLPVFIEQWVDTKPMYDFFAMNFPFIANNYGRNGVMEAEFISNFDALYIIIFQIFISTLVMKWKPLKSMTIGFIINAIGIALTLYTQNVVFLLISIFIFAIGEMMGSPKITEYIGLIAPKDKKALYMGFSFIPVFIGNVLAGVVAGPIYQSISDKHQMVLDLVKSHNFAIPDGLTQNELFLKAAQNMNMNESQLTNYLWQHNNPSNIWILISGIGILAALLLNFYNRKVLKNK